MKYIFKLNQILKYCSYPGIERSFGHICMIFNFNIISLED